MNNNDSDGMSAVVAYGGETLSYHRRRRWRIKAIAHSALIGMAAIASYQTRGMAKQ